MVNVDVLDTHNVSVKMYEKALEVLGEQKELHVMRGLVMNVESDVKESTGEVYYTFDMKVLKKFGADSEYGQSYNLYNIVVPAGLGKSDDDMKEIKGNEVVCFCSTRCSVRKSEKGNKFNSISLFAEYLELSRVVNKVQSISNPGKRKL